MALSITLLVLMLAFSFFFSGMEIAFLSSSSLKIALKKKQGSRSAKILSYFKNRVSEVLITILIGNNLALVLFTMQIDSLTEPLLVSRLGLTLEENYLLIKFLQSFSATVLILILAEYIPKALFRRTSDRIVYPAAYILNFFYYLLRGPVLLVNSVSKVILRYLFRVTTDDKIVELDRKDLDQYIQEVISASDNVLVPDLDTDMLNNALAFKETKARECMIPRTEIIAIPSDTSIDELMELFISSTLSKIIVFEDSMDKVRGFVHSHAMFGNPDRLEEVIQPVLIVPETMPANVLLAEFTENKRSVAIVVDEFGGTSGMITMEDLVEEVFGEIEDEHDEEEVKVEEDEVRIIHEDGSFTLGARLEIDDLNEDEGLDLELPEEEYYTTLGGLVMYYAEDILPQGESIDIGPYKITVEKATQTRLICVKLEKLREE